MRIGIRLSSIAGLCAVLCYASHAQPPLPSQTTPIIVFKVIHVYDSPGAWSGVEEFDQPIDVVVNHTSSGGFKVGQQLLLGIPVVYPSKLFDHKTASLSPTHFAAGKLFLVRDRGGCFFPPRVLHLSDQGVEKRIEASRFNLDPSCIEPMLNRSSASRR
jgi:hypothetical protein